MENSRKSNDGLGTLAFYNIAFVVSNIEDSIKWYTDSLGFKLLAKQSIPVPEGHVEMAFMEGAGMKIEMIENSNNQSIESIRKDAKTDAVPTVVGSKALVFYVEDLEVTTKELENKAVHFLWKKRYLAKDSLYCTMILDNDDNRVNIFQRNTII
ncbi:VOC family protein [Zunongwangia endophytica]|uniref:VOC family protein n=1 Tax=Zunongwangia endophytica TaxID=1808945 RepID=A0ABV8HD03_9FLAO|nr:VOC family protein [Zunongwangia endophytica]MDN3593845.1 VOC family protein [Zunongwangia endophytica]